MQKNPPHLPGDDKNGVNPEIVNFFERFPAASRAYATTKLFHFTHGINLFGIRTRGLQPEHRPFPPEHGEFLLKVAMRNDGDPDYVRDCIVDPSGIYLTKNAKETAYAIPRCLTLLCQGMHACINNRGLDSDEQVFAAKAFNFHQERLLDSRLETFVFQVNSFAPAVLNARLGRMSIATVDSADYATTLAENCDGTDVANVRISQEIPRAYLTHIGHMPFDRAAAFAQLTAPAPWMTNSQ